MSGTGHIWSEKSHSADSWLDKSLPGGSWDGKTFSADGWVEKPLSVYLDLPGTSGNYASTPDSSSLTPILGDLDVRIKVALDDWAAAGFRTLLAQRLDSVPDSSWGFRLNNSADGRLGFYWSDSFGAGHSVLSTAGIPGVNGVALYIRVTVDVDDGAGNYVIRFHTSLDGRVWNQLGSDITGAGVLSFFNANVPVEIGSINAGTGQLLSPGKVYSAQIRQGIDGPIAAEFNPANDASIGNTSFESSSGEVWTIHASGSPAAELVFIPYSAER